MERFVALVGNQACVLDVGCGPGRDLLWMKSHSIFALGIDLSFGMLLQARQKEIAVAQMDMIYLGVPNNYFDGVWCNAAVLHLPKSVAPSALREIRRILIPGGALYLTFQEGALEEFEQTPYSKVPLQRFFARYQMTEMEEILSENGFRIIERSNDSVGTRRWLSFLATKDHDALP